MENSRQKYWFYRTVSVVIVIALVFLLKDDLKRFIDNVPLSPSTQETQQLTPPSPYFFSPDSSTLDNSSPNDLDYIAKPTVPLYQYSKIIKPNLQKSIDTSGISIKKIKLRSPGENDNGNSLIQQKQSDAEVVSDFPDIVDDIGIRWMAVNQWKVIDFDLTRTNNRQFLPRIAQVNTDVNFYDIGTNNALDDQAVGSFGNRRIVRHIGNFNYTSQTLYNTYYSDFIVRSTGNYNTTIQNVFNAYNAQLSVTQNGSYNRVIQDVYSQDVFGTFNQTVNDVRQYGDYNFFRSHQVGVSNAIKTMQQGGFNNVDITQRGNHNSVQVHQSGQGNTVTINQN